jgi:scavenger receptor class B protein 1
LEIFIKSICRTFPLEYDREVTVLNGLPAKRYRPEPNVFGSSTVNEKNKCYCDDSSGKCPPNGVFDASKCLNLTLLMSYPHFYEGDDSLREHFDGLNPDREKHGTFADIHPRMAFPIGGASRMQVNFRVKPFSNFFPSASAFKNLPRDLILPICWFEISVENIPKNLLSLVYNTTHSANATYLTIQYGSLIGMFISLLLVLSWSIFYYKRLADETNDDHANGNGVVYVNKN